MQYLNILLFIFANGDKITDITKEGIERAKAFIDQLRQEFEGQSVAMDETFYESVADRYAASFPEVVEACDKYAATQPGVASVGSRGAFLDFIKLIIDNKEAIIELVKLIQDLFGPNAFEAETA